MKKKKWLLLAPLLVSFGANVCLADTYDDYLAGTYDGYEDVVQKPIYSLVNDFDRLSVQLLPVIEKRIKQISPDVVISAKDDSNEVKLVKYNNYLAQKVLSDYAKIFENYLTEKGKETGRKLHLRTSGKKNYFWLDRGDLDTDKCKVTYTPKDYSDAEIEKYRRDEKEHTCFYPHDFEGYSVEVNYNDTLSSLKVNIDDRANNTHEVYNISLSKSDKLNGLSHISVRLFTHIYDYNEYYKYLNQIRQDLKDGLDNPVLEYPGDDKYDERLTQQETVDVWTKPLSEIKSSQMIPQKHEIEGIIISRYYKYNQTK